MVCGLKKMLTFHYRTIHSPCIYEHFRRKQVEVDFYKLDLYFTFNLNKALFKNRESRFPILKH